MMSKFFIEHPVLANVLTIVLVLIGAICVFKVLSMAPTGRRLIRSVLLVFSSSRADGLSSEPSPGSIETADWQSTSRPQSPAPQPGFISLPHSFSRRLADA